MVGRAAGSVLFVEAGKQYKKIKKPSPKGTRIYASVKRVLLAALRHRVADSKRERGWNPDGSMTLEAAIVLPLFLVFCMNLSAAIEMIRLHGNIQTALWHTGRALAIHGLAYEEQIPGILGSMAFSQFYIKEKLVEQLGEEYLEKSPIVSGKDGLNLMESRLVDEEGCLDIKITYRVALWSDWLGDVSFRMCNRYVGRIWTGYDVESQDSEEELVYISDYGLVCHRKETCTHLRLDIRAVDFGELDSLENEQGSSYKACKLCGKGPPPGTVYIGREGDCYHYKGQCAGIKRTVHAVRYSRVRGMRMCSRCGG